jgi:hypothetical protein
MSLSKSKCLYSNNCVCFLEHAVPLGLAFKADSRAQTTMGVKYIQVYGTNANWDQNPVDASYNLNGLWSVQTNCCSKKSGGCLLGIEMVGSGSFQQSTTNHVYILKHIS